MPYETLDDKVAIFEQYTQKNSSITIWELTSIFGYLGHYILCAILTIPFLQPVPLMGFATIVGTIVSFSGILILAEVKILIPDFIKRYKLKPETCLFLSHSLKHILLYVRVLLKPRGQFMSHKSTIRKITGLMIAYCGFLLALPISVLGTNTLPALAILTMSLAALEEDGYVLILGYLVTIFATWYIWHAIVAPLENVLTS